MARFKLTSAVLGSLVVAVYVYHRLFIVNAASPAASMTAKIAMAIIAVIMAALFHGGKQSEWSVIIANVAATFALGLPTLLSIVKFAVAIFYLNVEVYKVWDEIITSLTSFGVFIFILYKEGKILRGLVPAMSVKKVIFAIAVHTLALILAALIVESNFAHEALQ